MGLRLVLNDATQQIVYEPTTSERQRGVPDVFRIKSAVTNMLVKDHTGRTVDAVEETDSSEISTVTVSEAMVEIYHYVPDLSGLSEDLVRDRLRGQEQ